jgi:electron transfer flavoprotein alpha subunit
MSILIYAEYAEGKFKSSIRTSSLCEKVAETLGTTVTAVTVNAGCFGVIRCRQSIKVNNDKLSGFTAKAYADVIKQAAEKKT